MLNKTGVLTLALRFGLLGVVFLAGCGGGSKKTEPPPSITPGEIYWTFTSGKIQCAKLDGSEVQNVITTGMVGSHGLAIDPAGGKIYWTDVDRKICSANADGAGVETLVTWTEETSFPVGIALDLSAGKMYWCDFGTQKIQRANLDGSGVEELVTGVVPYGIVLAGGKMYWTDRTVGSESIKCANLNGTSDAVLISGLDHPRGIAIDTVNNRIYWSEYDDGKICQANLDGSGKTDLITEISNPNHLIIDPAAGKIYWANSGFGAFKIQRANLDGTGVEDLVNVEGPPTGIALNL